MSSPEATIEPAAQEKVDPNTTQINAERELNPPQESKDETKEDPNWKAFREARKQDRLQRELAEKKAAEKEAEVAALKAAMEAAFTKNQSPPQYQNDYNHDEETEDQRIEKKVQAAITQREAVLEKQRHERDRQELPQRLLQAFPDYNQVVNEENGAYLEYHHPELYRSILRQPENFDTCSDIYKLVKKYIPNSTNARMDAAKAENNFSKPKSMSSTALTQTGEAMGGARLTEERRAANWERMQRQLRGLS